MTPTEKLLDKACAEVEKELGCEGFAAEIFQDLITRSDLPAMNYDAIKNLVRLKMSRHARSWLKSWLAD
jgi:hypothetical protein